MKRSEKNGMIAGAVTMFVAFALFLLVGCAFKQVTKPGWCVGQSYIWDLAIKQGIDPADVSSVLVAANYMALKKAPLYSVDAAYGALDNIEVALFQDQPTLYQIMMLISENVEYVNKYAGETIFVLGMFVPQLSYKVPIPDCDRLSILKHVEAQRAMLKQYFPKKEKVSCLYDFLQMRLNGQRPKRFTMFPRLV